MDHNPGPANTFRMVTPLNQCELSLPNAVVTTAVQRRFDIIVFDCDYRLCPYRQGHCYTAVIIDYDWTAVRLLFDH